MFYFSVDGESGTGGRARLGSGCPGGGMGSNGGGGETGAGGVGGVAGSRGIMAFSGFRMEGRVTTACLWHACRAVTIGTLLIGMGITMIILGESTSERGASIDSNSQPVVANITEVLVTPISFYARHYRSNNKRSCIKNLSPRPIHPLKNSKCPCSIHSKFNFQFMVFNELMKGE